MLSACSFCFPAISVKADIVCFRLFAADEQHQTLDADARAGQRFVLWKLGSILHLLVTVITVLMDSFLPSLWKLWAFALASFDSSYLGFVFHTETLKISVKSSVNLYIWLKRICLVIETNVSLCLKTIKRDDHLTAAVTRAGWFWVFLESGRGSCWWMGVWSLTERATIQQQNRTDHGQHTSDRQSECS